MNVESVAATESISTVSAAGRGSAQRTASGFASWFAAEAGQVNTQLTAADRDIQGLALGETQSLHDVMIRLEEARLSFQLLVQVRNRLLEAYQDVMRMQV